MKIRIMMIIFWMCIAYLVYQKWELNGVIALIALWLFLHLCVTRQKDTKKDEG